jgi:hypothetical protein
VTDPTQGRDGSPSVAALAIQVNGLRRQVEALNTKVDALASTQKKHAPALADITELRHRVEQILVSLDEEGEADPPPWFWLTMDERERGQKYSELHDWVETVLRTQYPDYLAEQIRPCWPNHPEARWELAWLYQLWSRAYLGERPALKDAANWHDRWSPGVLRRLGTAMSRCDGTCQRQTSPRATADRRR